MTIGFKSMDTSAAEAWRRACRAACGLEDAAQSSGDAAVQQRAEPPNGEEARGPRATCIALLPLRLPKAQLQD